MRTRKDFDAAADWHMSDTDKEMRTHRHMNIPTSLERSLLLLILALAGYAYVRMCVLCAVRTPAASWHVFVCVCR